MNMDFALLKKNKINHFIYLGAAWEEHITCKELKLRVLGAC